MIQNGVHQKVPKKCSILSFEDQFSASRKCYHNLFFMSFFNTLVFECDLWGHSESIVRVIEFKLFVVYVFLIFGIANV